MYSEEDEINKIVYEDSEEEIEYEDFKEEFDYANDVKTSPVIHIIFITLTVLGVVAVLVVLGMLIYKEAKIGKTDTFEPAIHQNVIEESVLIAEKVIETDQRIQEEKRIAEENARKEAEAAAAAEEEAKKADQTDSAISTTDLALEPQEVAPENNGIKTVFTACSDRVTPKIEVNLRALPSVTNPDATVVVTIRAGEVVERTGINTDVGWSRVVYNGQTLYCVSSYVYAVE